MNNNAAFKLISLNLHNREELLKISSNKKVIISKYLIKMFNKNFFFKKMYY